MQTRFSKTLTFQALALVALIIGTWELLKRWPDREELGARRSTLRFEPARWSAGNVAPLRLAGAWQVTSDDPRVGGISALALDHDGFVALTDSGVVVRFSPPSAGRSAALVNELPDGPGSPGFKIDRDSEALVADPGGRGWWVAFENQDQIWLYDRRFTRPLARLALGDRDFRRNQGIEGLATVGSAILAFPEAGDGVLEWTGSTAAKLPLERPRGRISDAARLPGGGLAVIHRRFSPLGFVNAITLVDPLPGGGYRTARSIRLRGTRLDNVEALAAERLPDGRTRLWLMTDDNFQRPLRTLLIALDVPKGQGG